MITVEQFNKEVCKLRQLMGDRRFWADYNKVHLAKKALCVCYLEIEPSRDTAVSTTFKATMSEFIRRALMLGIEL